MDITQIDTRIGSKSNYHFSHGNTLPLTGTPFAMNYLSVQTNQDNSWWFNPDEYTFAGIRLTHQPSPWIGDFQHFLFKDVSVVGLIYIASPNEKKRYFSLTAIR